MSLLSAVASSAGPAPEPVRSNWARPAMRTTLPDGPGAWWRSGLPRP
ncbi:MAG TPA: acyl-CoA carboxylase epsilon subunit [Actinomycetota bacterium]|nr:acyl-CoA carboxylase epsilon subunit [Actinomycetota bacterium]